MEKTSCSILNKNVLKTFVKAFNLKPVENKPHMFSCHARNENGVFLHVAIFDVTVKKNDTYFGINLFMPSYYVKVSYHGLDFERNEKSFEIFEYEDVRKVIDSVNNFIKTYNPAT